MRFLVGHCHDTSQTDPYTPLIEIVESVERRLDAEVFRAVLADAAGEMARLLPHIRQRYPDIPPPAEAPAQEQRRYLFMSVRDVFARLAAIRPLAILLDDLHWADGPTLMFLEHLAGELSGLPILVVVTYRVEMLPSTAPFHATLAKLHQRHLVESSTSARSPNVMSASSSPGSAATRPPRRWFTPCTRRRTATRSSSVRS